MSDSEVVKMQIDEEIISKFNNIRKEDGQFVKQCGEIAEDLKRNKLTILELVEQLGVYLIDKNTENREYGILILSNVLEHVPSNFLSSTQLSFICMFYTDRLKDNHQVVPAVLQGILAVIKFENIPEGAYGKLLTSLFHNVPCQQQQHNDRLIIYKIFDHMVKSNENELKAMGLDFVYGVISSIDSEKNPINLLYLFNWIPNFLKTVNLGHLTEEMFEVLSCYFPVDYRVPAQDSKGISREALAAALNPCLCAIAEFGEYSIPLAIEKLSSSLHIAKLDSLQLLKSGCEIFSEEQYLLNTSEIWSLIQKEVLTNKNDPELELLCLTTLTKLINKISENNTDNFKEILANINDTLKGNIRTDTPLFEPSCKILLSVTEGSKSSCAYIISEIVPLLINLYQITSIVGDQVKLFTVLIKFVKTYINIYGDNLCGDNDTHVLKNVPTLCLKAAIHSESQIRAIGLRSIGIISTSLPIDIRTNFYKNLESNLVNEEQPIVHEALVFCLRVLSNAYPAEIKHVIQNVITPDLKSMKIYLNIISAIADNSEFTEIVLNIILSKCTLDINAAFIGIDALKNMLNNIDKNKNVEKYITKNVDIINVLNDWIVINLHELNRHQSKELLSNVAFIFKLIIGLQESEGQINLINRCFKNTVVIIKEANLDERIVLLYILDGSISRLRRDVLQDFNCLDDVIDITIKTNIDVVQSVAVQLLSNIINKLNDDEILLSYINKIEAEITEMLNKTDKNNDNNVIQTTTWITKALVMRGHSQSSKWINKLINLLETHETASQGFGIVMNDKYSSLSLMSYCNQRLLFRQKFFVQVCTIMSSNYNDENSNYLMAVGYLLQETPKQILKIHFENIIKLIILCMDKNKNPQVLISVLSTLCALIESNDVLIEDYIQEFIPRFLNLARFKGSMKVRLMAIKCIQHYTNGFTLYKLLPHKTNVISTLGKCLDDHKRLVRKEAADARMKWFQLDAPI